MVPRKGAVLTNYAAHGVLFLVRKRQTISEQAPAFLVVDGFLSRKHPERAGACFINLLYISNQTVSKRRANTQVQAFASFYHTKD